MSRIAKQLAYVSLGVPTQHLVSFLNQPFDLHVPPIVSLRNIAEYTHFKAILCVIISILQLLPRRRFKYSPRRIVSKHLSTLLISVWLKLSRIKVSLK